MYRHSPRTRTDSAVAHQLKDPSSLRAIVRYHHDEAIGDAVMEELGARPVADQSYCLDEIQLGLTQARLILRNYGRAALRKREYHAALGEIQAALDLLRSGIG